MADDNLLHSQDLSTPSLSQSAPTTLVHLPSPKDKGGYLIDEYDYRVLQLVVIIHLSLILGLFGTMTNIINIVVFFKQGIFSGGSVLNLFFLAIIDLGVASTNFFLGIGVAVMYANVPDLPIEPFSIIYLAFGWPNTIFTLLNRITTAFIAFERCMCVVIPFRVKDIFAPRRCLVYLLAISTYVFVSHIPVYFTNKLGEVRLEGTNITKIGLVFTEDRQFWYYIVYYTNYFFLSFLSTVVVVVCTVVTSLYIRVSKQWRDKMSGAGAAVGSKNSTKPDSDVNSDVIPNTKFTETTSGKAGKKDKQRTKGSIDKEARLVKMITTISVIFFICYIPEMATTVFKSLDGRINTGGQYQRTSDVINSVTFLFSTLNSSINLFVYYRMSSKYKEIFLLSLGRNNEKG